MPGPRPGASLEQQAEAAERLLALTQFTEACAAGQQVLAAAAYAPHGDALADRGAAVFMQAMFELGRCGAPLLAPSRRSALVH